MILTESKILMRLGLIALLTCSTALAQSTAQEETGFIKHAAQLRDGPGESSRSLVALAEALRQMSPRHADLRHQHCWQHVLLTHSRHQR